MNITLRIQIRKRQVLRKKYLTTKHKDNQRSEEKFTHKKKKLKKCVSLVRRTKNSCYLILNEKNLIDNRELSKTLKPMLSNK